MEKIIGNLIAYLIMAFISAWVLWTIWPWVMVEVFHLPELEYSKAFWLVMIGWAISPTQKIDF